MDEAVRLSAGMLNKRLFVMLRSCIRADRIQAHVAAHLRWMIAAERRGIIFASGPFVAEGQPMGVAGGMTILRAASREEAEAIARQDPFIAEGVYGFEIREWRLMEGSFSVTVRYSEQSRVVY
jgi:uncharacterized protein